MSAIYFTTIHPLPACTCGHQLHPVQQARFERNATHTWSCPARCRSFQGLSLDPLYVGPPAPSNSSRCALGLGHDEIEHVAFNGQRWR